MRAVAPEALPNFFIVGAPKAGTTSLYHYLDQHPDVYMSPIKEPCYFASEVRPENFSREFQPQVRRDLKAVEEYLNGPMDGKRFGGLVLEWDQYLRLFRSVKGATAIGEASVCYLWSKTAAANIHTKIPQAKIIMILRDPAERAFSQYLHAVTDGLARRSFREQIDAALRRTSGEFGILHPFLEFGLYYEQVRRYLALFPAEHVRIHLFEEYQRQPARILAELFDFLQVDPGFVPDTSRRHLEPRVPRVISIGYFLKRYGVWQHIKELSPPAARSALKKVVLRRRGSLALDPRDRAYVLEYYRADIQKLASLLNRDLSAWLEVRKADTEKTL